MIKDDFLLGKNVCVFFKLFILQFQKAIEWKAFFFETMETLLIKTWN